MHRLLALALAATTLSSCGTATIQRWSSVNNLPLPASDPPTVRVTSAPGDTPAVLTAKGLPDHAGAAYIAALAKLDNKAKTLRGDMAKPIKAPPSGVQDGTTVDRVVLTTVERPRIHPGDRFLMTRIVITPLDKRVSFTNYQFAATDRSTINVGTLTKTDTVGATAGIGGGPTSAAAIAPSLSLTDSRTVGANRNVNQESIFAVSAEPDHLEIFRTGAEDRDLIGNTLIKLSVKLGELNEAPNYWVPDLTFTDDDTSAPLAAGKASVDNLTPLALYSAKDIWVCVKMDYEDRQVPDPQSLDEGRQAVTIATGTIGSLPQKLIPYQDLQQLLWQVRDVHKSNIAFSDGLTVHDLSFDDYTESESFLGWLKLKHPLAIKNGQLGVNVGGKLRPVTDWNNLSVEPVAAAIGAPDRAPPSCPKETAI
jgi:hypothetical protein